MIRTIAYGERAFLVEDPAVTDVLAIAAAVQRAADAGELLGVLDIVPGARSVLVLCSTVDDVDAGRHSVARLVSDGPPGGAVATTVTIDVDYDGADLADVAERTGLDAAEVVARHSAPTYVAAFCGFRPGFAYLVGLDDRLQVPRLDSPRTSVPAGAVAVAERYTGVYPSTSPGGWRLIGRTDAPLWDLARAEPALITPGTLVRFVPR